MPFNQISLKRHIPDVRAGFWLMTWLSHNHQVNLLTPCVQTYCTVTYCPVQS